MLKESHGDLSEYVGRRLFQRTESVFAYRLEGQLDSSYRNFGSRSISHDIWQVGFDISGSFSLSRDARYLLARDVVKHRALKY